MGDFRTELVREGLTERVTFEPQLKEGENKKCRHLGKENFQPEGATKAKAKGCTCSQVFDRQ